MFTYNYLYSNVFKTWANNISSSHQKLLENHIIGQNPNFNNFFYLKPPRNQSRNLNNLAKIEKKKQIKKFN
jgi:hypothetical protein